jgi:hypothetical protein
MATKQKRNWRQPHKIKVHDNRWLVWTVAIAILLCSTVVAYIQVSDINFQTQLWLTGDATTNWVSFEDPNRQYNFKHPKSWAVEAESQDSYTFVNTEDVTEYFNVTVYPKNQADLVREALVTSRERSVNVGGIPAVLITTDYSSTEKAVLLSQDDSLFVLRGTGSVFNRIVSSFRLTQTIE